MLKKPELLAKRAVLLDEMKTNLETAAPAGADAAALKAFHARLAKDFDAAEAEVAEIDAQLDRLARHEKAMAGAAVAVDKTGKASVTVKTDPYDKDPSIVVGGMIKMLAMAKGSVIHAVDYAIGMYGEDHPVAKAMLQAKALSTLTGASGGFVVPPDFVDEIIPLLYAKTVVRKAGAIPLPMPNGTMTIPKMTGGSAAYWIGETKPIPESAPGFGQVVATAHKLAALVPVSNDMMRYAAPQFDTMLRNDVVKQVALAEDAAFVRGAGTQFSPRGMRSFATALGTQLLSSTATYTQASVNQELAGLVNKVESANVAMTKPGWLMSPRTKNYLYNLQNSLGLYVYRDEMKDGMLLQYPFYTTTQIPTNLVLGSNNDCSELYFVDFAECMILESRQMEFAISTEGTYTDANGVIQSAFQNDLTLIRAIMAEDFQMRHDEAIALDQGVRWAPAIQ